MLWIAFGTAQNGSRNIEAGKKRRKTRGKRKQEGGEKKKVQVLSKLKYNIAREKEKKKEEKR